MIVLWLCLVSALAGFKIESPDILRPIEIKVSPANYGLPGFYKSFGRLEEIQGIDIQNLEQDTFAVYEEKEGLCTADVARKVKEKGGKGLIVLKEKLELVVKDCEGENPEVLVLGMKKRVYNYYFKQVRGPWVTYKYDLSEAEEGMIEIRYSGDHETDLKMTLELLKFNSKFNLNKGNYRMNIILTGFAGDWKNCIVDENQRSYCHRGYGNITGAEILRAFQMICSIFDELNSSVNMGNFFYFLSDVFLNCSYETNCIHLKTSQYNLSYVIDHNAIYSHGYYDSVLLGRFIVNYVNLFWISYLESAYCLTLKDQPDSCELCSPNCTYESLKTDQCSSFCDNPKCGYSSLNCKKENGCFSFMLNDGYCNEECENDPDCFDYVGMINLFYCSLIVCFVLLILVYDLFSLFFTKTLPLIYIREYDLLGAHSRNSSEINNNHQIESIPVSVCPIDLAELEPNDVVLMTPCGHVFHEMCFKDAVEAQESIEKKCPCCREKLNGFSY